MYYKNYINVISKLTNVNGGGIVSILKKIMYIARDN